MCVEGIGIKEKEMKTSKDIFVTTRLMELDGEMQGDLKEKRKRDKIGKDKGKHFQRTDEKQITKTEHLWRNGD